MPMNNVNQQARPGVQGGIAPTTGTPHYGNMQNLGVAQQHNMQARQKPNQGPTVPSHYIGAMQQQSLGPGRQGVPLTAQQQQQQALQQQQQLSAQQRLGPQQQQAMARQTQSQQMMQNQGNTMLVRGSSTGAQMQGISTGVPQQAMYSMGKPAQYQQQQQQPPQQQPQQQQARPQMVSTSSVTNQARPGTPGAAAQTNNTLPSSVPATAANTEPLDATGSILGKRSIQDLLAQIDPEERLDPDVEEVLLEIADDFIESVTSFAVKLAKHRKSDVLEAKDVLLHLDKQWNITVPGFGGDEYRSYKRPSVSETHKQRLSVVRKSAAAGQAAAESKALSAAPATNASTPVKSGLSGLSAGPTGSPSGGSPGMPRLPRV